MLSVERRREVGMGFGMDEDDVEEGEALDFVDPDVALSYIDDKIEDVLGHFQKDFEGEVSAENLGAKFGGYGSFLPAYQRSPSNCSQTRSPLKPQIHNVVRSPYNSSFESVRQNPSVQMTASVSKNNTASTGHSLEYSGQKGKGIGALIAMDPVSKIDSSSRPATSSSQNTLKVRLKVGPDNISVRNNAAIYSGLGLDDSPSSSAEDSPDVSGEHSPDVLDVPQESPTSILQAMALFPVMNEYLLSPLPDSLSCLTERSTYSKSCETDTPIKGSKLTHSDLAKTSATRGSMNYIKKKSKSDKKSMRSAVAKNSGSKNDMSTILKREIDIETLAGQELVSDALNIQLLSSPVSTNTTTKTEEELGSKALAASHLYGSSVADDKTEIHKIVESFAGSKNLDLSTESTRGISSMNLVVKNNFESKGGLEDNGVGNSGNVTAHFKGKQRCKFSSTEKASEEKKTIDHQDASSDKQKVGRGKFDKGSHVAGFDGSNVRTGQLADPGEFVKQNFTQEATKYVQNGETLWQGRNLLSDDSKKAVEGSQSNGTPSMMFPRGNMKDLSSLSSNAKKSSHAKVGRSEMKSKSSKSHKESSKGFRKDARRDSVGNVKTEQVSNRSTLRAFHAKDKSKNVKLENEKAKEKLGGKHSNYPLITEAPMVAPIATSSECNAPILDAVAVPFAPVLVEDNWVCCDKCQKWRLLPNGTNPDNLPKKWLCNMQTWLPIGMNKCVVSEEETTKVINPQYHPPIPESDASLIGRHNISTSCTTLDAVKHFDQSLEPIEERVPTITKRKQWPKDASTVPNHSASVEISRTMKKKLVASQSLNDVNPYSPQFYPLNEVGMDQICKSADFTVGKQKRKHKEKHRIRSSSSDGGHYIEKSGKYSKSKSKGEANEDDFRINNKKVKTHGSDYPGKYCDADVAQKEVPNRDGGLLTNASGRDLEKWKDPKRKDKSSFKESLFDSKGNSPSVNNGRLKPQLRAHSEVDAREYFGSSDAEKSDKLDLAVKKRKVEEWQEGDHQKITMRTQQVEDNRAHVKQEFNENDQMKGKRAKPTKSESKESLTSKSDGKMDKTDCITRISGRREHPVDSTEGSREVGGREHSLRQYQGNVTPRQTLDGIDSLKKDSSNVQTSTAATSGTSKLSDRIRSKSNILEARCSPVESVTSSPFRALNTDKLTTRKDVAGKDEAIDLVCSVIESPKRCSDAEVNGRSDRCGTGREEKVSVRYSHKAGESRVPDSFRGRCDYQDEVVNQLSSGNVKGGRHSKASGDTHDTFVPAEIRNKNLMSSAANDLDKCKKYVGESVDKEHLVNIDMLNETVGNGHAHNQEKVRSHHRENGPNRWKSGKSSSHSMERDGSLGCDFDKNKLKVSGSLTEQEDFFPAKNGSSCPYEADSGHNYYSTIHEDLKNANCKFEEDEKGLCPGERESIVGRRDHLLHESLDARISSTVPMQKKDSKSTTGFVGTSCGKATQESLQLASSYENEKSSDRPLADQNGRSQMETGKESLQSLYLTRDNQGTQSRGSHLEPTPHKGSRSEVCPTNAVVTAAKVIKQPKRWDNPNVGHHSGTRQSTPNGPDAPSPIRKDGHSAVNVALKEARDLKHSANRLKNEGLELESIGLYFQAALKFLHVAFLWEPSSVDSIKQGEVTRSMQMYTDTAKLCEYCAHEYERCKEMAAAAIAYKLVEVAHFKVAYFKQPIASKDRNELQTALQMVLRGESPSSSASDVDNLITHGILDKAASGKGVSSPQIGSNHVVAARSSYSRWLDYTNETIIAFEASRKSHNAFAAAIASLEKDGVRGISSVKEVLNFNFHNVGELLRLARLSMESISR